MQAIKNKGQQATVEAIEELRRRLPFPLLGIDCDNGSEFINAHLFRYCGKRKITFTRGRPYKKNDNCYVEQSNFVAVRIMMGYVRYEYPEELELMNKIYPLWEEKRNHFHAYMKCAEKIVKAVKPKRSTANYRPPIKDCWHPLGSLRKKKKSSALNTKLLISWMSMKLYKLISMHYTKSKRKKERRLSPKRFSFIPLKVLFFYEAIGYLRVLLIMRHHANSLTIIGNVNISFRQKSIGNLSDGSSVIGMNIMVPLKNLMLCMRTNTLQRLALIFLRSHLELFDGCFIGGLGNDLQIRHRAWIRKVRKPWVSFDW